MSVFFLKLSDGIPDWSPVQFLSNYTFTGWHRSCDERDGCKMFPNFSPESWTKKQSSSPKSPKVCQITDLQYSMIWVKLALKSLHFIFTSTKIHQLLWIFFFFKPFVLKLGYLILPFLSLSQFASKKSIRWDVLDSCHNLKRGCFCTLGHW